MFLSKAPIRRIWNSLQNKVNVLVPIAHFKRTRKLYSANTYSNLTTQNTDIQYTPVIYYNDLIPIFLKVSSPLCYLIIFFCIMGLIMFIMYIYLYIYMYIF